MMSARIHMHKRSRTHKEFVLELGLLLEHVGVLMLRLVERLRGRMFLLLDLEGLLLCFLRCLVH